METKLKNRVTELNTEKKYTNEKKFKSKNDKNNISKEGFTDSKET